jgi:hypothetical protein
MKKRYKFLRKGNKSENGNHKWTLGKWYKFDGGLEMCKSGFHCSKGIYQAFSYVQGEILAEVEIRGKHLTETDKEVWSEMRVVKTYAWTKIDSVLFSIYTARLCLDAFEKAFPDDKRPRLAIEAAEKYTKYPTKKNGRAARAAGAAAEAAAWAAEAAAWAAAWAAEAAAEAAAKAAAEAAVYKKLDKWMLEHLENLKEVK